MLAVYLSSQRIILSVSGLCFGILICMSEHVIITFLGGKWTAASPIVLIVAILAFIQSIGAQVEVSKALGLPRFIFVMSVFRTFGVLVLVFPLTKVYGPIGSALSILFPVVCLSPITMNRILRELNGSKIGYGRIIGPPIIAIVGCMVAIGMIKTEVPRSAAGFFILLTVYSIVYLVLIIKMDFVFNGGICNEFTKIFNSLGFSGRRSA
jgi:O-antigen/teichoic acid export membrane protein